MMLRWAQFKAWFFRNEGLNWTSVLCGGALLFAVFFAGNLFICWGYQADSEATVRIAIDRGLHQGVVDSSTGPHPLRGTSGRAYFSSFGLQARVLTLTAIALGNWNQWHYRAARALTTLLLSITLMTFVVAVARQFGVRVGCLVFLQILFSKPLMLFAANLFWVFFLCVLPFSLSMFLYPRCVSGKLSRSFFYALMGELLLIKSLCGYEYLSSIVLSISIPVLYYELQAGTGWGRALRYCFIGCLAGAAGFVCAFALNFRQVSGILGSWDAGWQAVMAPAVYRTIGDRRGLPFSLWSNLCAYTAYFTLEGQSWLILLAIVGLLVLRQAVAVAGTPAADRRAYRLWSVVLLVSFLASLSWNTLALGHMRYHRHINFITFYLPFNLVLFAFNGYLATFILQRLGALPAIPALDTRQ